VTKELFVRSDVFEIIRSKFGGIINIIVAEEKKKKYKEKG
jgi:hypothetical protein